MNNKASTKIELLHGLFGSCSGTINDMVVTKTGVIYLKPIKKKKERIIREPRR